MLTRDLLEKAAKACGIRHIDYAGSDYDGRLGLVRCDEFGRHQNDWNPLANNDHCAEMNADLGIDTYWIYEHILSNKPVAVECASTAVGKTIEGRPRVMAPFDKHKNDRSAAWRYASTAVAAQMGANHANT